MWSKTDTIIHTKKPFYGGDTFFRSLGTCALGFFFIPLGLFAEMSTRTYRNEYDVLTEMSTRTYWNEYVYLLW